MITLLSGENSFELTRALDAVVAAFDGTAEKFDGSELELSRLPDLVLGGTLFATDRLVIIKDLSSNKQLWDLLPDLIARMDDSVRLVLVEQKPDKRTKTYKDLKKIADVKEFSLWGDRDISVAEVWVANEAKRQNVTIDKKGIQTLVDRVGLDQWQLYYALQKLSVLDEVTPDKIREIIEANPSENVFNLLEAALRGNRQAVSRMISGLQSTQDPYMTFGLLSGQVFQLAALATTSKSSSEVASDIGAHPYAVGKLSAHAKSLGRPGARKIITIFADTDTAMKSTGTDPWLLIEKSLVQVASI